MKAIVLFVAAGLILCSRLNAQTYTYDFSSGYEGWSGDFADYPVEDSVGYELAFARERLPAPLDTTQFALKITGNNHSDDLFMFIKTQVSGLLPNTEYDLLIDVEFASNAPTNAIGIGGAPGEGVRMKAGATLVEPLKVDSSGFYVMNIDKGNQSEPGMDMDTIGHVGVADTTTVFTLINRSNETHLFNVTTDANGEVWVAIGTDSGFEGTTTLYYTEIALSFMAIVGTDEPESDFEIVVYPNPTSEFLIAEIDARMIGSDYYLFDESGSVVLTARVDSKITRIHMQGFTSGMYVLKVGQNQRGIPVIKK